MQKWEYRIIRRMPGEPLFVGGRTPKLDDPEELNELGNDGWELITIVRDSGYEILYFKRQKSSNSN
jgi:Domain of unknown function (DUF4177)